jgi:hypothetical protein
MISAVVNDEVVVLFHTRAAPGDAEWNIYVDMVREYIARVRRVPVLLVYSCGGAPNAGQRARAIEAAGGKPTRVALITNSSFARGVATIISWFGVDIRSFTSIAELPKAAAYLELDDATQMEARQAIERMARELTSSIV